MRKKTFFGCGIAVGLVLATAPDRYLRGLESFGCSGAAIVARGGEVVLRTAAGEVRLTKES